VAGFIDVSFTDGRTSLQAQSGSDFACRRHPAARRVSKQAARPGRAGSPADEHDSGSRGQDANVALSTLVEQLNERFGTDFTEAGQLFFDQVRATAERDEKIVEAAKANTEANFAAFFGRILDDLFIQRMEGNDEIFNRVMNDQKFRGAAQEHLAREVYERVSKGEGPPSR
jgi:type I restriction enzyme R subunit